jgi:hypothetical protein
MDTHLRGCYNSRVKFKHAVFCYLILDFDAALHSWLLLLRTSRSSHGLRALRNNQRDHIAAWALDMLQTPMDLDAIIKALVGDEYFNKNKRDIVRLEKQVGRSVMELWDTDPIFEKYPNLRGLARNLEFEKLWAEIKTVSR